MSLLRIDFSSIEALMRTFDIKLYQIPMSKQREMIDYASKIVLEEVKAKARKMALGGRGYALPSSDGHTIANAAVIDRKHMGDSPPYAEITFKGNVSTYYEPRDIHPIKYQGRWFRSTKKGVIKNGKRRIGEVAFLNEYGVPKNRGQGARGYLSQAMADGMDKAFSGLCDILEEFIADALVKVV